MASSSALLLLALGCGCALLPAPVAAVEDATAMVQMGASAQWRRGDDEEEPKRSAFGNFFKTLATGASADGQAGMSNFFDKASSLANTLNQVAATPAPQEGVASSAEGLSEMAKHLEDWGKKTQSYFSGLEGSEEKQDKQIFSGIKQRIASVIPAEVREKAADLRSKAAKAKESVASIGKVVGNFQQSISEQDKEKTKERLEVLGGLVKKRLDKGVDYNSRDAKNLRNLINFFKDDQQEEGAAAKAAAADKSPLAGINELASNIRRAMGKVNNAPAPVRAEPAAAPAQPAAIPQEQQPAALQQQMAAPPAQVMQPQPPQPMAAQPQPLPPMQPQQWGPPQQAWQPAPQMMPMGAGAYSMGAPPVMGQYPMGGMRPYPQQMR